MIKLFFRFFLVLFALSRCPSIEASFFQAYTAFNREDLAAASSYCAGLGHNQKALFLSEIFSGNLTEQQFSWFLEQEKTLSDEAREQLGGWLLPKASGVIERSLGAKQVAQATEFLSTFTHEHKAVLLSRIYPASLGGKESLGWYVEHKTALKPELQQQLTNQELVSLALRVGLAKTLQHVGSKPRIALVTIRSTRDTGYCHDLNTCEYAAAHGYDFYVFPVGTKMGVISQVLDAYDWVCWMDADTLVMNMQTRLESLIDPSCECVVAEQETTLPYRVLNTGVFLVKNSANGRRIVEEMTENRSLEVLPLLNHFEGDQAGLNAVMLREPQLAKVVKVVSQRVLDSAANGTAKGSYQLGDFVLHFVSGSPAEKAEAVQRVYQWREANGSANELMDLCRAYPSVTEAYQETNNLLADLAKKGQLLLTSLKEGKKPQAQNLYNSFGNDFYRAVVLGQLLPGAATVPGEAFEWLLRKKLDLARAHQDKITTQELAAVRPRVEQAKKAAPGKLRIALVSVNTQERVQGNLPGGFYGELNKQQYATKHGYDLYIYHAPPARTAGEMGLVREGCFHKVQAVLEVLEGYDWVFWLSPNALIVNMETKLEAFADKKADLVITKEASPLPHPVVSTGSFLIKNSATGKRILNDLLSPKYQNAVHPYATCPGDQKVLTALLAADATLKPQVKLLAQRTLNAQANFFVEGTYQAGDFVVNFDGGNGELLAAAMRDVYTCIQEKRAPTEIVALCKKFPDTKKPHLEALEKLPKK